MGRTTSLLSDQFDVRIPPDVQTLVEGLKGKSAGYAEKRRLLGIDPCDPVLGAYRLSGPLGLAVCGLHLKNGYRLAFTMQDPVVAGDLHRIVIIYVGKKEPGGRRSTDMWDVIHDLFGVENPQAGHFKPPCCEGGWPSLGEDDLAGFLRGLRALCRRGSRNR